ncbi:MAG: hypothetical protein WB789_04910 [Thermoplasmata archaeon]
MALSEFVFLAAAVGLLLVGLLLWYLERRNPRLLAFSPRVTRWTFPVLLLAVLGAATATWFTPPPLGPSEFPGLLPLALAWGLGLFVAFLWLHTHPARA